MKAIRRAIVAAALCAALAACQSASTHRKDVEDTSGQQMTVGKVQREIHVGMSSAQVAQVLGSPNVVTTDAERREVWVYDKVSTTTARSSTRGGLGRLILGRDSASNTSQKTLTVIVNFDEQGTVRDFAYHTSRF